jgi:acetyl esterase/lipase
MKKLYRVFLLVALITTVLTSCKKDDEEVITAEAKTLLDVAYGTGAQHTVDVYLPANRSTNTSVIIFVHGGAFISGDKVDFNSLVKELVNANFAVVNANYTSVDPTGINSTPPQHLESKIKVKDQVTEMSSIVDLVRSKAKEWNVSRDKIGMAGHSAGATLSLLYGYDARNTNKVKAIVNIAGSLDLTYVDIPFYEFLIPKRYLELGYRYTGYEVGPTTDVHYRAISPLYVANANQKIPTLSIFPEFNDVNGLPKQGKATFDAFTAKLNSLGVPNKFVQIAGADHEFSKPGNVSAVLKETIEYFNVNLK